MVPEEKVPKSIQKASLSIWKVHTENNLTFLLPSTIHFIYSVLIFKPIIASQKNFSLFFLKFYFLLVYLSVGKQV